MTFIIELKKLTWDNLDACIALSVKPEQDDFIANNIYGIAQSYVALTNGQRPYPFAAYNGDMPVGFVFMLREEEGDTDEDGNIVKEDSFHIVRFMIDKEHQGRGYGKELMRVCLNWIERNARRLPVPVYLSYNEENAAARGLYSSFGFNETGERNDSHEVISKLMLG